MEKLQSMIKERGTYNGWANYKTWNVALWLQNDEEMYKTVQWAFKYDSVIPSLEYKFGQITPDGVRWMDPEIDTEQLDAMIADF